MPKTCENCRHWRKTDPNQLALAARTIAPNVGECLRFPPRETGRNVRTDSGHWCGEWVEAGGRTAEDGRLTAEDGARPAEQPELLAVEHARPARRKGART